jgi:hypothetical protein
MKANQAAAIVVNVAPLPAAAGQQSYTSSIATRFAAISGWMKSARTYHATRSRL